MGLYALNQPYILKDSLEEILERYKLISYASEYWADHTRDIQAEVQDEILNVFQYYRTRELI